MILLSKNEAQAKAMLQRTREMRQDVANAGNAAKEALEAICKKAVTFERITSLLAINNQAELSVELFKTWKEKKGIDLPLDLIRTDDEHAWPPEVKSAFYAVISLQGMSKELSRYWDDKKKSFVTVPLTEEEKKAVFDHFMEYVASKRKKEHFEFMRVQAEILSDYNTLPHIAGSPDNQITPSKLAQTLPHFARLLKGKQEGRDPIRRPHGYFVFEVNKDQFVQQAPRPELFI